MKSIVFVIPTLIGGGMERVASEFANFFADNNYYKVSILMFGNNIGSNYKLSENINIIKPMRPFSKRNRVIGSLKSLWFIRKTVNKLNPDIVLSFGEFWNSFVLLSLIGTTHNVYISDRCQPDKSIGSLHDFLRKWLYPKSKGFIVQTNYAKKVFSLTLKHQNITVIPNPINIDKIRRHDRNRENIVVSVGRLIKSKHFDLLIKIFAQINRDDWKLVIVGDDINNPDSITKLRELCTELKCTHLVELAGHQNNVNVIYERAKIFAFTSSSEGFPNVLIEAMSHGLPVVAFDCSAGPSDIITDNENGFLIPLFDETAFKKALVMLMNNEDILKKFSNYAAESVKRFAINNISDQLFNFLK